MSGLVASRRIGSWRRLALVSWMLLCGQIAVSAVDVNTFVSADVPARIPEAGGAFGGLTESTVVVGGILTPVSKLTVTLYLTHQVPGDCVIRLIPPAGGNGVELIGFDDVNSTQVIGVTPAPSVLNVAASTTTGLGTSNTPLGRVTFDSVLGVPIDPADTDIVNNGFNAVHLLPGIYLPSETLAAFNGLAANQTNGTWTLRINDQFAENYTGTLVYWDITITEPGPHTWTGAVDDNWTTAGNWLNDSPPAAGETGAVLIFPADAVGPTINNLAGDIGVNTLSISGAYGFTATTGKITLQANSTTTVNAATDVNFNMPIDLLGQPTVTVNGVGAFNLLGLIANDGPVAAGLIFAGTGPKSMSGANTYTGATAVYAGVLDVASNTALGTNAAGTTVTNGASVRLATGVVSPDTITIEGLGAGSIGSLVFSGNATLGGITLLAGKPATISVLAGAVTVTNVTPAATAATHTLTVTNAGTLAINGALPNRTALTLNGGATTFGAVQPNITTLSLTDGADLNVGASATVSGTITVSSAATSSIISGTALNFGGAINVVGGTAGVGFETSAVVNDLLISATITGAFEKRGGGVLRTTGTNTGVAASVTQGVLAASGALGSVAVGNGSLSLAGTLNVGGAVSLAGGSGFILQQGVAPVLNAASVNLGGVGGVGGAVLQAYSGAGTTIITTTGNVTGTFDGKPQGAGITYNAQSVVLAASGGRTMAFTPAGPFAVDENSGTLQVTVTASSGGTAPLLRAFGGLIEGRDVSVVGLASTGTFVFTVPIVDNFVDTGDVTGSLAIVPQDGSLVTNSATLTVRDNDTSDTKTCGFGTGLTVFLLLGLALMFQARLRRP
jgi:autotransporter-associated beta strand protein